MRKIREVLRLRFELRLGQRAIARACSISQSTVHEYLNRAAAAGVVWPLGEEWDEQRGEEALFGEGQVVKRLPEQVLPDFPALHSQLQQHRHLTLQLAWEEYRQIHPEGYGYSRFCELYQRWRRKQDVVLRQVHQPGEKGFVDWAGATIPVHDPVTGEVWPASLFVMVLGTSSYTYAEATRDQQLTAWISAHIHAFEYFSGVPRLLVPDNLRTGVRRACRYDPDVNPTYQEFAMHYDVGVVPARPHHPKDKAKVEVGVQVVERWILAALRHQKFFRLADLNKAIRELLERLNQRPFRKREGSRASVFAAVERTACRAVRHEPVVLRPSQHRLPHRLRRQFLQRALHAGARTRGSSSDTDHHRDLSQGVAGSLARSWSWTRTGVHAEGTPTEESPSASRVDSLTHGALGRTDRTAHGRVVCTDPRRKTASGDGVSILPGDHPTGRAVLLDQDGSGCGSSHTDWGLPLPEREIDPEELARSTTTPRTATATSSAIA